MIKKYKSFPSHQAARCFHCDAVLVDHKSSGYPNGRYVAECEGGCGMRTWYDIETEEQPA